MFLVRVACNMSRFTAFEQFEAIPRLTTTEFYGSALSLNCEFNVTFILLYCLLKWNQPVGTCSVTVHLLQIPLCWGVKLRKSYINPISFVIGFQPTMLRYCLMHTLHLGLCHFLNAGGVLTLMDHPDWFDWKGANKFAWYFSYPSRLHRVILC